MKRSIINQLNQLSDRHQGYVAALNYRYLNLCIKAEEASLLPVQVVIENEVRNIEEVAYAGKKDGDEYSLYVAPKILDDLIPLSEAVLRVHPEFKLEGIRETVDAGDGQGAQEVSYLKFTMPEVNDDRYDVLKEGVDTFYNMCKADMTAASAEAEARLAVLGIDEKPEDLDNLKKAVDEVNEMWAKKRDELRDEKLKEIEEAHAHWQAGLDEVLGKERENDAAHNDYVARSIKLNSEE